jgi:hypothetical protein
VKYWPATLVKHRPTVPHQEESDVSSKISTGDVRVGSGWSSGVCKFLRPRRQCEKGVCHRHGESQLDAAQHSTQPQQIFQNRAAPFINSLVNGTSGISKQVAYANAYINAGVGVHPSEPNYIWAEAGTDFGVNNDDDPYKPDCTPDSVQSTTQHLSTFLTIARKSWRSYQEDTDVDATNMPLPASSWTVPLFSHSGVFTPGVNAYN